jgi:hypothetical protein
MEYVARLFVGGSSDVENEDTLQLHAAIHYYDACAEHITFPALGLVFDLVVSVKQRQRQCQ